MPVARSYQPTLRDRAANKLLSWMGNGPTQQHFVEGLMGSTGLGTTGPGVVDFIPGVGQAFQADEAGRQMGSGHPMAGGANLLMAALPLPAAAKEMRGALRPANRLMPEAERAVEPIVAYHGSPHTFDRFDLAHVGSGEGAQAYGHGLYFAENEDVAKGYKDRLGNGRGATYQVAIKAPESRFLDWDTPLGEHPEDVQDAVLSLRFRGDQDQVRYAKRSPQLMNRTAGSFLNDLANDTPGLSASKAAQGLADKGVAGVKYLDHGSRGLGGGTRNFVVFNPETVDILKRYGIAGALAPLAFQRDRQ